MTLSFGKVGSYFTKQNGLKIRRRWKTKLSRATQLKDKAHNTPVVLTKRTRERERDIKTEERRANEKKKEPTSASFFFFSSRPAS